MLALAACDLVLNVRFYQVLNNKFWQVGACINRFWMYGSNVSENLSFFTL